MKPITGKKGMIPRIRELLGAGKSDEQIIALVKPQWPICTPYEIGYARRTQKKHPKTKAVRAVAAARKNGRKKP